MGKPLPPLLDPRQSLSRRGFLKLGAALASAGAAPRAALAAAAGGSPERTLSFYNVNTGERLDTAYWAEDRYLPDALEQIDHLLRDHRNDAVRPIDVRLLDLLHAVKTALNAPAPLHLICGYRSPATNAMLAAHSRGVAKHSLHMTGQAADIRIPGHDLADLRKAALALRGGGVGYYPRSDFVHLDVGPVRTW